MKYIKQKTNFDLVGKKFSKLLVIKETRKYNKRSWECLCDCGNITFKLTSYLLNRKIHSCGCSRVPRSLDQKVKSAYRDKFNKYRNEAKLRKYEWCLEFEDFYKLVTSNCSYCNEPPSNTHRYNNTRIICNGVDRINNELGYLKTNVVSSCAKCNSKKGSCTIDLMQRTLELAAERNLL